MVITIRFDQYLYIDERRKIGFYILDTAIFQLLVGQDKLNAVSAKLKRVLFGNGGVFDIFLTLAICEWQGTAWFMLLIGRKDWFNPRSQSIHLGVRE